MAPREALVGRDVGCLNFYLAVGIALAVACSFQPALGLPKGRRLAVLGEIVQETERLRAGR